ncbi:MAG: APC family permease [Clostridiales bacterium]|nr:APC family permease [Clostridiales bacterium]
MFKKLQSIFIGKALRSNELTNEKYSVFWGLPILSSDAISSVAYASEEILRVLVPVLALGAYKPLLFIALGIVALLGILVFSYRQTIDNYPHGGGSYIVATDNIGRIPGLIAAASLTIDYVLTIAVSTCAGTAAITSAFPNLLEYKVIITVCIIAFLTIGNLRGMKDSSKAFGVPTYLFIISIIIMIITGIVKVLIFGEVPEAAISIGEPTGDLTLVLLLKAFSSGCTALTGVEAVSDGIPNFKEPSQKNAKKVLTLLALIVFVVFGGISFLATMYKADPTLETTVISQISSQIFGHNSIMFFIIQGTTAIILIMAANTAFADLPLLLSILARDGYMPRQFSMRGKRLSFSNGILFLFALSTALVIIFNASTHLLLPLYAVGVFISFTLSQFGMFRKWVKHKEGNWKHKAIINGFGALVTAITCVIIGVNKFYSGAWIVLITIPIIVLIMIRIKTHYNKVADNLRIDVPVNDLIKKEKITNYIIVPIQTVNKSFIKALNYALAIGDVVEAYHVSTDDLQTEKTIEQFKNLSIDVPLIVEHAPYRNINEKLLKYIDEKQNELKENVMITVVLPKFVIHKWWHNILHNQTSMFLRTQLTKRRNISVTTIPYIINE